ncbi:PHP domain-containing protein [Candidatus Bathycorpusculum sp.]|uniref:PHP domain-containing protein n=1 Tax=Candidatus Bathycorpusculum sp. TaxID=2994959 RepID=UPI00281B7F4A|nr:PHP domain-containing protein [Candidatus Termitimicrobium sp.]
MLKIDMHIHSIASGHSISTVNEIVTQARRKRMTHIAIIEHGPSMVGAPHQGYFWISDKLPRSFGALRVFYGCEANIIDSCGQLDLDEDKLRSQSIVLAGLHERTPYPCNLSRQENTNAIVNAMKNRAVSIISHPIRPQFPIDIATVVEVAAQKRIILELNTQYIRSAVGTEYIDQYKLLIDYAKKYDAKLIINSDAHAHYFIGDDFVLRELGKTLNLSNNLLLNFDSNNLEKILEEHKYE